MRDLHFRRSALVIACATALVAWAASSAVAIAPFYREFKAQYLKSDGTDVEKAFAAKVNSVKCAVCHGKDADGTTNHRTRNVYGEAVGKLLAKTDAKDKEKIVKSLNRVFDEKVESLAYAEDKRILEVAFKTKLRSGRRCSFRHGPIQAVFVRSDFFITRI